VSGVLACGAAAGAGVTSLPVVAISYSSHTTNLPHTGFSL
jgi:hypothetical protein